MGNFHLFQKANETFSNRSQGEKTSPSPLISLSVPIALTNKRMSLLALVWLDVAGSVGAAVV